MEIKTQIATVKQHLKICKSVNERFIVIKAFVADKTYEIDAIDKAIKELGLKKADCIPYYG
jgi:hypothetical protein